MIRLPLVNAPGSTYVTNRWFTPTSPRKVPTHTGRHRQPFGQPRVATSYKPRHMASVFSFHNRGYVGRRRRNPSPFRIFGGF